MTKDQRKEFIRSIVNRGTVKAIDVSAFASPDSATAILDDAEMAVSIPEAEEKDENDMGKFISRELAEVEGERIAKVREVDYSVLDEVLSENLASG